MRVTYRVCPYYTLCYLSSFHCYRLPRIFYVFYAFQLQIPGSRLRCGCAIVSLDGLHLPGFTSQSISAIENTGRARLNANPWGHYYYF